MSDDSQSWLAGLPTPVQTAVLSGGSVAPAVMARIPRLVQKTYFGGIPSTGEWELHPRHASALLTARCQPDDWWNNPSPPTRATVIEHSGGPVPNEHRAAVGVLGPLGVAVYADATSNGPFQLHPLVAAYIALREAQGDA